ncbi:hypothetical protein EI94DRAFT_1670658, partial [Lactarius quietus]
DGLLNPCVEPTQPGFTQLFAAWLIKQDLPFTTGESGSIKRLFKYIQCRFSLPSDTTVRNALEQVFIDLHGTIVREIHVRPSLFC